MSTPEPAIIVDNISKHFRLPHETDKNLHSALINRIRRRSYEEFTAVDNLSFTVNKGEFFSIIGRNGSGKSTLLRMIAGIYPPDTGSIERFGTIAPFLSLGIGFNNRLSGRDNVYLSATILGIPQERLDEVYHRVVEFAEMERFIDQKVGNYSSGMRSRLAFAVAIHADREILLLDEVLAVGDVVFRRKCMEVFESFIDSGKTIIFVSHGLGEVKKYSDRVLVLIDGENKGIFDPETAIETYKKLSE